MNEHVLKVVEGSGAKLVAVTKYLNTAETQRVINSLRPFKCFWGIGENRVDPIQKKNIDRSLVHFIGNIQSRDIPAILKQCRYVHSLYKESHFEKIEAALKNNPTQFFLQINISGEATKAGIPVKDISKTFFCFNNFPELKKSLIGISALGTPNATEQQTMSEMGELKKIRDQYIPSGHISYGTSQDYAKSIQLGAAVVRIGRALLDEPAEKM